MASQTTVWAQSMLGQTLKGQYRLEGILGEGAMGVVFRGVNQAMGKAVAIKMMRKEAFDSPDALERFNREARVWSQLNHPAIAQVFDFGLTSDQPFLVMEIVEGADLSEVIDHEGPMESLRAVKLMRQLAAALEEAHRVGVIHRDIKPQNMKLLRYQPGGKIVLKVLDFGMAKQVGKSDQRLTAPGILVGTPKYVAPEQITENPLLDGRTDLYAAGVMFYELLTGQAPFLGTPHEVLLAHLGTPPRPLPDSVAPIVSGVVMRLLAKHPHERFADAAALDVALEECEVALRAATMPAFSSGMFSPVGLSGSALTPVAASSASAPMGPASAQSLRGAAAALVPISPPNHRPQPNQPSVAPSQPPPPSLPSVSRPPAAPTSQPRLPPPSGGPALQRLALISIFLVLMTGSAGLFYALRHSLPLQRAVAGVLPSFKVPQDHEVAQTLQVLEAARKSRQWAAVLHGVLDLEQRYGGTLLPDQAATLASLRQQAQSEQPMEEIYNELVAAGARKDSEAVVRLHGQLVADSIYHGLAQPAYAVAIEAYVIDHLGRAEAQRQVGRCAEFLSEVQQTLNAAPGHPLALAAGRLECPAPPPVAPVPLPPGPAVPGTTPAASRPAAERPLNLPPPPPATD